VLSGSTTRSAHRWACKRAGARHFVGVPPRSKIATGSWREIATGSWRELQNHLGSNQTPACPGQLHPITDCADATGGGRTHAAPVPASASWTTMCTTTP
jgi:hypothetical protein